MSAHHAHLLALAISTQQLNRKCIFRCKLKRQPQWQRIIVQPSLSVKVKWQQQVPVVIIHPGKLLLPCQSLLQSKI
jgi:hypothetical protein